jgi:GTP-binding protein
MLIKSAKFVISNSDIKGCPAPKLPEVAFIGRSNVGKSSLINMLVNHKGLAKTSAKPGKTQLINHFIVNDSWYLVDLPGYGFAKVSASQRKKWEKMIEGFLRTRETLVNVFALIDARHSPQQIDLDFINKLGEWQVPFSIVFTKSDKETQKVVSANVKAFTDAMRARWTQLPSIFVTSAEKRTGRTPLLSLINTLNDTVKEEIKKPQA